MTEKRNGAVSAATDNALRTHEHYYIFYQTQESVCKGRRRK